MLHTIHIPHPAQNMCSKCLTKDKKIKWISFTVTVFPDKNYLFVFPHTEVFYSAVVEG